MADPQQVLPLAKFALKAHASAILKLAMTQLWICLQDLPGNFAGSSVVVRA
jgi:hypothetical protein